MIRAEFWIDEQGEAHFKNHTDESFAKTKEAFIKWRDLLNRQLENERQCPHYEKPS